MHLKSEKPVKNVLKNEQDGLHDKQPELPQMDEESIHKKRRIELLDVQLRKVASNFSPQKALNTAEFQKLLVDNISDAVSMIKRLGQDGIDFTHNYRPSSFQSYVAEVFNSDCFDEEWIVLIDMLAKAGLLTRNALSKPIKDFTTAQHLAITKSSPFLFRRLNEVLDRSVLDWEAVEPTKDGDTPLTFVLGINCNRDLNCANFTDDQRHMYDLRAVELINFLPDRALNTPDKNGHTPLTLAISNCRVLALNALIQRMPAVDFFLDLRKEFANVSKEIELESVDDALERLTISTSVQFKSLWPEV